MPLNHVFVTPGTYTIEDNGVPGDNISVIRDQNGVIVFTFVHPADALNLTVNTPGVHIIVNFSESLAAANFTIGSLTNASLSPESIVIQNVQTTGTAILVSNGSITEGGDSDAAPDILAGAVILSAASGIGAPGNAIETQTGLFEAETTTGGIAISNFGSVQIGGLIANVDGLDVVTSGDIVFTTVGSIFLTEANSVTAAEVVHGGGTSGNVTLIANGFSSDITGTADNGAVTAPRGSIVLVAGQDIKFGTVGANFNNDLVSNGGITFTAGRDIVIDGFADILSDNFGLNTGSNVVFTAARNIGILNVAGTSASVTASGSGGGDAIFTTGLNGSLTVNGPGSFALGSTSGDVIVRADRLLIDAASGISAPSGSVTIGPATDGRPIILGSASDAAFAVELSDAEIDRIFTDSLFIGTDQSGTLSVIAPITVTVAGSAPDVFLTSATSISMQSSFTTTGSLTLRSLDDVFQTAASTITTPTLMVFVDAPNDDPGAGGTATLNGTTTVTTNFINGSADNDILNGNGANNTLQAAAGNDTLRGFGGNDILNGGSGFDTMVGGLGNDIFFVDNLSDSTEEAVGQGNDQVFTSISYNLGAGQEIEFLSSSNQGGTVAINLTGNAFNQEIVGNNGDNVFIGGGGADRLVGFGGNDLYAVDSADDSIQDDAGQGFDQVFASSNYTLGAGVEIEFFSTLNQAGTAAINLTGNSFSQQIVGNNGVNVLVGGGGTDTMVGFGGNDVYFVDSSGDIVTEAIGGGGFDVVYTSVSYTLAPGSEVEGLASSDPASVTGINLVGNAFGNFIVGNAGGNFIDGKGGADVLEGGAGGDIIAFSTALGGANVDTIVGFQSAVDLIVLDDAIFTGLVPGALPAGAFRTGTSAQDADDRIVFDPATGNLFFDADGNGAGAAIQFATLQGAPAIAAADFIVA